VRVSYFKLDRIRCMELYRASKLRFHLFISSHKRKLRDGMIWSHSICLSRGKKKLEEELFVSELRYELQAVDLHAAISGREIRLSTYLKGHR
jgi:hypothetical protein